MPLLLQSDLCTVRFFPQPLQPLKPCFSVGAPCFTAGGGALQRSEKAPPLRTRFSAGTDSGVCAAILRTARRCCASTHPVLRLRSIAMLRARRKNSYPSAAILLILISAFTLNGAPAHVRASANAPTIQKIEPPNWWANLTPDLIVLLSGKNLQAAHAACTLAGLTVSRTQASPNGDYLLVWLNFSPQLKSGTAVCRITNANGQTSFNFPIASRKPTTV
jgi:hypothetical protein